MKLIQTAQYDPTDGRAIPILTDTLKTDHPDWRTHREITPDSQLGNRNREEMTGLTEMWKIKENYR